MLRTLDNPAPAPNDNFGYSVAISGNLAVIGAYLDDPGGVTDAGRAYVFDLSTGALLSTLSNPTPAAVEYFGYSVAISGNVAIVGAYGDSPGGVSYAGTAYTFNATTGAAQATLANPAAQAGDAFGFSVAISGNLAVVGASLDNPGAVADAGTAYVFDATTGVLQATLSNPAPTNSDNFGGSVGISGNYAIVGSHQDDPGGVTDAGSAFIFNASTGALLRILGDPAPAASDFFGHSVAIDGTLAVVGADQDDPAGISGAGRAFVFDAIAGVLQATLANPNPVAGDLFGASVGISGNLAVVGAPGSNPSGIGNAGSAYVFNATTGVNQSTMANPAPTAGDLFGASVAISGGLAIAGAYQDDPGAVTEAGTAYVFTCLPNSALDWTLYD